MSRLIEKLNQVSKAIPKPMGFRIVQSVPARSRMLLIGSPTRLEDIDHIGNAAIDAFLFKINKPDKLSRAVFQKITKILPDVIWGTFLGDASLETASLIAAQCDFVAFSTEDSASDAYSDNKLGKVLELQPSLGEDFVRAVNDLPVDAVLIHDDLLKDSTLSWHQLMLFQRFANLLAKPLLAPVPLDLSAGEVKAIWQTGIDAIVVKIDAETTGDKLEALRKKIDSLIYLPPRKRGKAEALLPYMAPSPTSEIEEE